MYFPLHIGTANHIILIASSFHDERASIVATLLVEFHVRAVAVGKFLGSPTATVRHNTLVRLRDGVLNVLERADRGYLGLTLHDTRVANARSLATGKENGQDGADANANGDAQRIER